MTPGRGPLPRPLTVLDLFSGIGGFSLGLERTGGFKTIAFCEIDPFCRQVLAKHWPGVPIYEDVTTLSLTTGFADVICGGFPCQDISSAGAGAGITGSRSGLWSEYARIIGDVRPNYIIVENVSALLHRGMDAVLGDLAALGYDAEWHCIPASSVGAPHRRDRVWIVAYPNENRFLDGSNRQDRNCRPTQSKSFDRCEDVSDTGQGRPQRGTWRRVSGTRRPQFEFGRLIKGRNGEWPPEPDVGRVANGISNRVDRIGALGNAVVPQIPEIIGRAILAAHAVQRPREVTP